MRSTGSSRWWARVYGVGGWRPVADPGARGGYPKNLIWVSSRSLGLLRNRTGRTGSDGLSRPGDGRGMARITPHTRTFVDGTVAADALTGAHGSYVVGVSREIAEPTRARARKGQFVAIRA